MTRSVLFFPFSEFRLFTRVDIMGTVLINMMRVLQRSTGILEYITSRVSSISGSERTFLPSPSNLAQALRLSSPRQGVCGIKLWFPGLRSGVVEGITDALASGFSNKSLGEPVSFILLPWC